MNNELTTEDGLEIAPGVRVRLRPLKDYQQNPDNPVSHSQRNREVVLESIRKVGAARSGFASKGKILAGNLTWEAMTEAGVDSVIEITTDGSQWVMVNREDLTGEQEKQAAYGDQHGAMLADWNPEQMLTDFAAGLDLSEMFTELELERITIEPFGDTSLERDGQNVSSTWKQMRDAKKRNRGKRTPVVLGNIETWIDSKLMEQVERCFNSEYAQKRQPVSETFAIIITAGIEHLENSNY